MQQQETQKHFTRESTAGQADQDAETAVWRELAEELRQIPQLPEESVQGVAEADSGQGLLQRLRQAAGREDADAAAEDRVRGSQVTERRKADKKGTEKRDRPVRKQNKTQASGFDPHLMLSRLAQPVTKLTAKVLPGCFPKSLHDGIFICKADLQYLDSALPAYKQHKAHWQPAWFCHAQEAAVVAELPLPPEMQTLEQIFQALNAVHSFLLSAHIQVGSWVAHMSTLV